MIKPLTAHQIHSYKLKFRIPRLKIQVCSVSIPPRHHQSIVLLNCSCTGQPTSVSLLTVKNYVPIVQSLSRFPLKQTHVAQLSPWISLAPSLQEIMFTQQEEKHSAGSLQHVSKMEPSDYCISPTGRLQSGPPAYSRFPTWRSQPTSCLNHRALSLHHLLNMDLTG